MQELTSSSSCVIASIVRLYYFIVFAETPLGPETAYTCKSQRHPVKTKSRMAHLLGSLSRRSYRVVYYRVLYLHRRGLPPYYGTLIPRRWLNHAKYALQVLSAQLVQQNIPQRHCHDRDHYHAGNSRNQASLAEIAFGFESAIHLSSGRCLGYVRQRSVTISSAYCEN